MKEKTVQDASPTTILLISVYNVQELVLLFANASSTKTESNLSTSSFFLEQEGNISTTVQSTQGALAAKDADVNMF